MLLTFVSIAQMASALAAFSSSGTKWLQEGDDAGLVSLEKTTAKGRVVAADPYAWERAYERPWESIQEDESGMLKIETGKARRAGQR